MKLLKLIFLGGFLISAFNAQAKIAAVIGAAALKHNQNLANVMPEMKEDELLISREQYVLSYNREKRSPNWVEWKLEASDIGAIPRTNAFAIDPDLDAFLKEQGKGELFVEPLEYYGGCFDRGHQLPSKDRTDSSANNQFTFMMTNMLPQTAFLNRVIWEHLEEHTRNLVQQQGKKLYVIAGPVYDEDFGTVGAHQDIPIPSQNFKIIYVLNKNQSAKDINDKTEVIAVLMPNVFSDGSKPVNGHCLIENRSEEHTSELQSH